MQKLFSLGIIFLFNSISGYGVAEDSLTISTPIPTVVRFVHSGINDDVALKSNTLDSGLISLSQVNPAVRGHYNSLGNLGSALNPQVFKSDQEILTVAGIRAYEPYKWTPDSLRFYRSNKRFSQLDYHNSTFKEQEIRVIHSQNILKNWSAGLDFHRLGVKDFTRNGDTYQNQLALYTWYESPNKRYNLFLSAIWNVFKNQVNGGLKSDSLFDLGNITNLGLKGLSINLSDAKHHYRNHNFSLQNRYNLLNLPDSGSSRKRVLGSFQFIQSTNFESGSYAYSDAVSDSIFYSHFYNSSSTYDSLHYYDLRNSGGFLLPQSDSSSSFYFRNFTTVIEAEHQWFEYSQRDDFHRSNYSLKGRLFSPVRDSSFGFLGAANFVFAGENRGMYTIEARAATPQYKPGSLYISANANRREADFMYQNYYSNHFIWTNDFNAIHSQSLKIGLTNKAYHFQLEFALQSIQNYVYVGSDARPAQFDDPIEITQVKIIKNFSIRKWHLDNEMYFQNGSQDNVLYLPAYCGSHALYLENDFFKKAMRAQVGFNLHYNSGYYANAFMPATALFYNQNERKTGDYPMIDFFIHMKIKTARIFLKVENLSDGIFANRYFLTPHYPQAGRLLQFGLSWRFFDM